MIGKLIGAGVNVFRLNFSHGAGSHHQKIADRIRRQAGHQGKYVGILADLQGPKIRVASFVDGGVRLFAGDTFLLSLDIDPEQGTSAGVGIEFEDLPNSVEVDDILLLDDGKLRLRVEAVAPRAIECTVLVGGRLGSRKGVNKLGGGIAAPALTEKDKTDIALMSGIKPDFVAVSFVASAADIVEARQLLKAQGVNAAIIAKIERAEVVADNSLLNEIIDACEGVMVARGDLGIEVGDAELIGIQKDLISRTRKRDRMVITATQMMESMISNSMPTRAEVFDVANAVLDGTDAVMLSAETAAGDYPVETVLAMAKTTEGAEQTDQAQALGARVEAQYDRRDEAIALGAMYIANHLKRLAAIVCITESGSTPLWMSRSGASLPIVALSHKPRTLARMALFRGVKPLAFDPPEHQPMRIVDQLVVGQVAEFLALPDDSQVLLTRGDRLNTPGGTSTLKIVSVEEAKRIVDGD